MAFEQLFKGDITPAAIKHETPISPTLVLGLGGTGKDVLLRLRRLIVERFGSLDHLPCLEFLHIDTDQKQTAKEQYDLKSDDDPLYKKIRFQPSETIPLTIDGGTNRYISHIHKYPHIKRWFQNKGKIAGLGDLGEGAGQIRMASRLSFFHEPNFTRISDSLNRIKSRLQDPKITEKIAKYNFAFNPQSTEIFVITSIGGGTGSGIFIDIGFLLRKIFSSAERVGMLFMPTLFGKYAGHPRIYANGYAALMELNNYSFGNKFLADWTGRSMEESLPPPFSYTYFIDATNESNFTENNEKSLYQMIAETIFQDYSVGGFAGMKRSTRVNLVQYTMNVYLHDYWGIGGANTGAARHVKGDTYPTRFSSLGLGVISFPVHRVRSACASRLAREILEFWQSKIIDDPLEKLITSFLTLSGISFFQGEYDRRDGGGRIEKMDIEDEMLYYNKDAGETFQDYLWGKNLNAKKNVQSAAKGNLAAMLQEHRDRFDQLMTKEDSEDSKEWGEDVRLIESNMRSYLERLKKGIKKEADRLANSSDYGIAYTLSLLRALKEMLPKGSAEDSFKYLIYFEESTPAWQEAITDFRGRLEQLHMDLERHDSRLMFRTEDVKRDIEHLFGTKEEPGVLYNYMFARVMKQVVKRSKLIIEEIDEFLGKDSAVGKGLLSEYHRLLGGFAKLNSLFKNKEAYFSRDIYTEKGYTFWISLYREGDVSQWYETWMGKEDAARANVEEIGNRLLKNVFNVDTVTEALAHIERTPEEEIEEKVLFYCKKYFDDRPEQPAALEIFMNSDRFSRDRQQQVIKQAFDMSRVWVKGGGIDHVNVHSPGSGQKPFYIGVDGNDKVRRKDFLDIVDRIKLPGEDTQVLDIGGDNKSSIVFYNELAGITAFYPYPVAAQGGLKQRYNEFYSNSGKFDPDNQEELHTDKNRFQFNDLIPKTDEESIRYKEAVQAFVLARLLGMLRVEITSEEPGNVEQVYCYQYRDEHDGTIHESTLGDEANAMDLLFRDTSSSDNWRVKILEEVDKLVNLLIQGKMLANYLLLIEFYQRQVYPLKTETDKERGNMQITRYSPQYAILETERKRIYEKKLAEPQLKQQAVHALNALRGRVEARGMKYNDYTAALESFSKVSGKFGALEETSLGNPKTSYHEAFALDTTKTGMLQPATLSKKVTQRKTKQPVKEKTAQPGPETAVRPCPCCGQKINIRAIFCFHCKKELGRHLECPHCGETKVPEDLQNCWKCGRSLRLEKKILCPKCFSYEGYQDEFPCKVCGYIPGNEENVHAPHDSEGSPPPTRQQVENPMEAGNPGATPGSGENEKANTTPAAEENADETGTQRAGEPGQEQEHRHDRENRQEPGIAPGPAGPGAAEPPEQAPDPEPRADEGKIECPNCFEMVEKGPRCLVCQAPLDV
ncbi:MAG: hypothetical protein KAW12_12005 [Candidatus Aminicenantes bacterium]|nr:hypothetical protein [Candidatus Aminicenantes bacterium]